MLTKTYLLRPFIPDLDSPQLDIVGRVSRAGSDLSISYEVILSHSESDASILTQDTAFPWWKRTRLLSYVKAVGHADYCEFKVLPVFDASPAMVGEIAAGTNVQTSRSRPFQLSSAHDEMIVRYSSYRQPALVSTRAIKTEVSSILSMQQALHTTLKVDLSSTELAAVRAHMPLKVGIAAEVMLSDRQMSYWALAHPTAGPDFHHACNFQLSL